MAENTPRLPKFSKTKNLKARCHFQGPVKDLEFASFKFSHFQGQEGPCVEME